MKQKHEAIRNAEVLVDELKKAENYNAIRTAILTFVASLDSTGVIGDGEVASMFHSALVTRGKDFNAGAALLATEFSEETQKAIVEAIDKKK